MDGLFVETWVYDYGLLDEYAVNAYWSGRCRECLDACITLLATERSPLDQRPRFVANARFALDKLPQSANPGSLASTIVLP